MLGSAVLEPRVSQPAPDTFTTFDQRLSSRKVIESLGSLAQLEEPAGADHTVCEMLNKLSSFAQQELSLVAMRLSMNFYRGTLKQLRHLLDVDEWDEEDVLPTKESLASFARAMANLRPLVRPMLGLSSRGHVLAMWADNGMRLSLEHLPNDQVQWSLVSEVDGEADLAAGKAPVFLMSRILAAHQIKPLLYG